MAKKRKEEDPEQNEELPLTPDEDAALDAALDRTHAEATLDERADVITDILGGLAGDEAAGAPQN